MGKKPGTTEIMVGPVVTKLAPAFHIFLPSPWPVVDAISLHVPKGSGADARYSLDAILLMSYVPLGLANHSLSGELALGIEWIHAFLIPVMT